MIPIRRVAVLVGSLRRGSISRRLAEALIARAPTGLSMHIVPIGGLPLYDEDEEDRPPPAHVDFRAAMRAADAVLFVTPEYNRGVPGALKNAIDVGSRPYGESVFDGRPAAIVSQSPGPLGGVAANLALRPTLMVLNMPTMAQPEMYLGLSEQIIGSDGGPASDQLAKLFDRFLAAFRDWVERHALIDAQTELAA